MKLGSALALFFVFGLMTENSNAADVGGESGPICFLTINGEIDNNTPSQLASRYNSLKNGKPDQCSLVQLYLNSNGGNIEAAMKAGEFVRQKKIWTVVANNDTCASACVLLFVGGVDRGAIGNIGLHRPFTDELSASESTAKAHYEKTKKLISQYLNRMNIPEALLNAMNTVPPSEVKWLTVLDDERLKELQIVGEDPVYADERDSAYARKLGISKKEYYYRQQRIKAVCGDDYSTREARSRRNKCLDDVMNGRR